MDEGLLRKKMTPTQSRISLSFGRASDGPRTVSDLNLGAFSLAIYALWFFLTVFSASGVFEPSYMVVEDGVPVLPYPALSVDIMGFGYFSLQASHAYVFLTMSAISLVIFGLIARKSKAFKLHRWYLVAAGVLGCVGVILQIVFPADALPVVIASGVIEGFSASIFIFIWGAIYARYEFATSIINAALAFAVGMILAISLVSWFPSQVTAVIDALLPLAAIPILFREVPTLGDEGLGQEIDWRANYKVTGYVARMMISLLLLGTLIGALCVLCGAFLLTSGNLAIELVMISGSIISCGVFVWAIAIARRETRWDSLFRYISPIIALAFCLLPLLFTDAIYIGTFFLALACVCIQSLTWVFLSNNARNLSSVPMASFAFGFAIIQVGLIVGSVICQSVLVPSLADALTGNSLLSGGASPVLMQAMILALILTALLFFTYSVLPRYRELKTLMSSMLRPLVGVEGMGKAMKAPTARTPIAVEAAAVSAEAEAPIAIEQPAAMNQQVEIEQPAMAEQPITVDQNTTTVDQPATTPTDVGAKAEKGSFKRRCEEISRNYMLSEREKEVMFLLAKGHNAAYILDQLCISRSTVKTHINHIYKKLDIHTQQELLNMVEERHRGPSSDPEERDLLVEAARRLSADGTIAADPTRLVHDIDADVHSRMMQR